jgi:class 3 adenylate cyclase
MEEGNTNFGEKFTSFTTHDSVVVSIDIRDSTSLMLNAKSPESFAHFISSFTGRLTDILISNYGIYDKFTGDGLLCFFPGFYSGEDSMYYALKTATEAHKCFKEEYEKSYDHFSVVRADIGLGIGVDIGKTNLISINPDFTIVGIPVVYACRLSASPAGHTYLNQPAYEVLKKKYPSFYSSNTVSVSFKNQGNMLAYDVVFDIEAADEPKIPEWMHE